jgi:hypothetical protein
MKRLVATLFVLSLFACAHSTPRPVSVTVVCSDMSAATGSATVVGPDTLLVAQHEITRCGGAPAEIFAGRGIPLTVESSVTIPGQGDGYAILSTEDGRRPWVSWAKMGSSIAHAGMSGAGLYDATGRLVAIVLGGNSARPYELRALSVDAFKADIVTPQGGLTAADMAAPVGEVMTPIRRGKRGRALFRSCAKRPSPWRRFLSSSKRA